MEYILPNKLSIRKVPVERQESHPNYLDASESWSFYRFKKVFFSAVWVRVLTGVEIIHAFTNQSVFSVVCHVSNSIELPPSSQSQKLVQHNH